MSNIRIVLAGGGTGGHVFPIISVVRQLRSIDPSVEFYFIGPASFGREIFAQEGVPVIPIIAGKIPRYVTPKLFIELLKIPIGFVMALWYLFVTMPDIVFGKGGFGMLPVALVAKLYRIPVIIHESDAIAGIATRIVSRIATQVLTSFPKTKGISRDVVCVGNPVRRTLIAGDKKRAQERYNLALSQTVLILGGSQGAEPLNALMLRIAPELAQSAEVIHQVGTANEVTFAKELASVLEPYEGASKFYRTFGFLNEEEMADAYAVASVVVARSGASLIFELAELALPTIFLPLETSAQNHQYANAEAVAGVGGALLLAGRELTPNLLLDQIKWLLDDTKKRQELSNIFASFARPDAATKIAQLLFAHVQRS